MKPVEYNADYWGLNTYGIPARMHEGLLNYVNHRIVPGGFLRAVLQNNLVDAFAFADAGNRLLLGKYAEWLYNYAPEACWGSPEKMAEWVRGAMRAREVKQ